MKLRKRLSILSLLLCRRNDDYHIHYRVGMMILIGNAIHIFHRGELPCRQIWWRQYSLRRHRDIVETHVGRALLRNFHSVLTVRNIVHYESRLPERSRVIRSQSRDRDIEGSVVYSHCGRRRGISRYNHRHSTLTRVGPYVEHIFPSPFAADSLTVIQVSSTIKPCKVIHLIQGMRSLHRLHIPVRI